MSQNFPAEAYAPNGVLWWLLEYAPDTKRRYGAEPKIAAWLHFNKDVGETFTLRELRIAIPTDELANSQEHFNRRLRELRKLGWQFRSSHEDATLRQDEYRLAVKGWHPGDGPRPKTSGKISGALRRRVLERDGHRCVICGVANGEPYPDPPQGTAVMSIGHRIPQEFGGTDDIDNLQVECKRCNEPVREEAGLPETLDEVYAQIKGLKRTEKSTMLQWLRSGRRTRSKLDVLYDRARRLNPAEREQLAARLETATNQQVAEP
ncbi:HNH endonuclease [Nocardia sp. CDC160]|uniref:HNH endonuclease n=1 Tax=Nocardia sp. CDC160 TaxID=3112166 RepID=UPI002DBEE465|nr:HNH endonuclease [Nocardia sp. CDC160]MEC3915142.1 HNH endonuclease [Nocardia sp. CDC160]